MAKPPFPPKKTGMSSPPPIGGPKPPAPKAAPAPPPPDPNEPDADDMGDGGGGPGGGLISAERVHYHPEAHNCGNCQHMQQDGNCEVIGQQVHPDGGCDVWEGGGGEEAGSAASGAPPMGGAPSGGAPPYTGYGS